MRRSAPALLVLCRAALVLAQLYTAPPLLAQLHTTSPLLRLRTDKENVVNKSLDFVNTIREDLRRDNDDYAMLERHKLLTVQQQRSRPPPGPPAPLSSTPPPSLYRNHIPPVGVRAPAYRALPSMYPPPPYRAPPPRLPPKPPINTRKGMNVTQNLTAEIYIRPPNATQFRSNAHFKHYKKVRVDKLKRLVDRNRIGAGARDAPEPAGPPPEPAPPPAPTAPSGNSTADTPEPAPAPRSSSRAALRQAPAAASPSPDQLDMAPARGPQITLIRFKGRLCQRSVLAAEGPTYDAQGRPLRPAYRAGRAGRPFHHTRAPALVLPRCCNCCKKSVLGCQ